MRGALIVFEGAEGVGKTTQLRRVGERLSVAGHSVTIVREPGGTPVGDEIRRLLLDTPHHVNPRAEALLFMASRAQLIDDVIGPALRNGAIVLADRFFLSTYAYQAAGRGLDESSVRQVNAFATDTLTPDLTVLLDLPGTDGPRRVAARGTPDRVERAGNDFHARVAAAFRLYATAAWQQRHPECGRIVQVAADGNEDVVTERILVALAGALPETFGSRRGSHIT